MRQYTKVDDLSSYKISTELSDYVWEIVIKWDYFSKDTIGKQLVRAIDSIPANIAEGFGRYFRKDKTKFFYYARGSVFEAQFWAKKSKKRGLISDEEEKHILEALRRLPKEINIYIKWQMKNLSK